MSRTGKVEDYLFAVGLETYGTGAAFGFGTGTEFYGSAFGVGLEYDAAQTARFRNARANFLEVVVVQEADYLGDRRKYVPEILTYEMFGDLTGDLFRNIDTKITTSMHTHFASTIGQEGSLNAGRIVAVMRWMTRSHFNVPRIIFDQTASPEPPACSMMIRRVG